MPGDFTDLLAWQEASALVGEVHAIVRRFKGIGAVQASEQLVAAAESITANIVEGYGRGLGKDYCRFLPIAIGSAAEVEDRLYNAVSGNRIEREAVQAAINRTRRARALTVGLLRWVERQVRGR